ncbi:MAG TPA: signal peptide peptidase SppA [Saprospiraceae bacterium]|nr:signal peptide peptidase SppA [Saprospiraceae bacterium]
MSQFFKFLFASCLGFLLAIGGIILIGTIVFTSIAANTDKPKKIEPNSVIHLTFEDPVPELTNNVQISPFTSNFEDPSILGLQAMIDAIERAKDDDDIKGIYIEPSLTMSSGFTTAREIREALVDFRESGKFIYAHSGFYMQPQYYMSSVADRIYGNPTGYFEAKGFAASSPFFEDMLNRLGAKVQVFYAGKFKSATEPFRRQDYSPENKLQLRQILNQRYDAFLDDIATSRGMDKSEVKRIVDEYLADSPENAEQQGLLDGVKYREEVIDEIKGRLGLDEEDDLPMVSLKAYNKSNPAKSNYGADHRIAVVYAEGSVLDGKGDNGTIGDRKYVKDINKLAEDDRVKAIVLRVNSPGGSALASENIWNALRGAKAEGKPIVVSMGDYAASGGYYISAPADSILAEPNTLTGSIGVFRVIPAVEGAMKKKLGIDYDSVKTGPFAMPLNLTFEMTEAEKRKMQANTEATYQIFLNRVAEGRNMPVEEVHKIAQGRVWTGRDALEVGLVDKIGDLDDAMATAARMADVDEYRVITYPKIKDPLQQFLEDIMDSGSIEARMSKALKAKYPELATYHDVLMDLHQSKGVQARTLVEVPFE